MQYRGFTLDGFQRDAIQHLDAGRSVLVCAPTGTGKTIIADWVVDEALSKDRRVVYTAPIKALSNQKFRDYTRLHGDERVGLVTGDLVIRRDAPCRVMTTEILRNMLLSGEDLSDLHAVVVDEIHFLDDRERGTVWEEILIYLPSHVLIVGLSATLSNVEQFSAWLSEVRGSKVEVIIETKRAVPLTFSLACVETGIVDRTQYERRWRKQQKDAAPDDRRQRRDRKKGRAKPNRHRRHVKRTRDFDVVRMLIRDDMLPCLYFAFSRREIENNARHLLRNLRQDIITHQEANQLDQRLERARDELGDVLHPELQAMYSRGIAFHHAGLHVQLKTLVEELYESKLIKVLYCTSTFALGLNMPARSVAFDGIKKYDGRGVNPLSVRGFMQKAGRAGRRGMDDIGHVVLRIDLAEYDEVKPLLDAYFEGRSEPVRSSFNLSWNSVVNLLARNDREAVRSVVERSFLNWNLTEEAERAVAKAAGLEADAEQENRGAIAKKKLKEARRLRRRADRAGTRCWDEFVHKEQFLRSVGYIAEDGSFNAGALVLARMQIAEIMMTELVLSGLLDGLDSPTLFGVLCSLVSDFPRKANRLYSIDKETRDLAKEIEAVRWSNPVVGAEELTKLDATFSPAWIPLGRAWVMGDELAQVLQMIDSPTDISGDIVGSFRRAKDLAKQLSEVYGEIPDQRAQLVDLARLVSRDEVEVIG